MEPLPADGVARSGAAWRTSPTTCSRRLHRPSTALAEGNYLLATQRGKEPPRFQTFAVKSDATTALQVTW